MEHLLTFFGRFHPLIVHLPIGILILAFIFEALSLSRRYRKLGTAIQPSLAIGAFFSIASVVTGLALSQEGGYESDALEGHQYAGIATAVFAVALYFIRKNKSVLQTERRTKRPVRLFIFIPLMIALTITGHLGGSLTHGEEFITEFATFSEPIAVEPSEKIKAIAEVDEAVLYHDVIQPILEAKCYSCHSSTKQKGELRLDGPELIAKGGKHGAVIESGLADSSALFYRLLLPMEDDHHMPPNEKPQLSSAEIDLIRLWINDGAAFDKRIKSLHESTKAKEYIALLVENSKITTWLPEGEVSEATEAIIDDIRSSGALVLPVSIDNNYLTVSFVNSRNNKNKIEQLLPIQDQLVSLRLSYCDLSQEDLSLLRKFKNLTWLYLDHTSVSDSVAGDIASIPNLKYLNLVGTKISNSAIGELSGIKTLEEVYFYQSQVTADGIRAVLKALPNVKVDSGGYSLPKLTTDTLVYKQKA